MRATGVFESFSKCRTPTAPLRYEPCTQFINVSQRTLHIYFIDGCRRIKIERNNLLCEQAPTEVFRSIFAWLVTLNLIFLPAGWQQDHEHGE